MLAFARDIAGRRELLWLLVQRNIKIRYKSSVLGFLWSLMTPLLMIAIYAVFAGIMKWNMGRRDFLEFLVVGVVVWQFLATCVNDSLHAITGNSNLIKKTAFPRVIIPLAQVLANLANFLLTVVVLVGFLLVMKRSFHDVLYLPVVILTQTALCLGLALFISALNVFIKDTEHILGVALMAWFFLSPVFYAAQFQLDRIPAGQEWLVFLNPMTGLICAYRSIFMAEALPGLGLVALSAVMSWLILLLGLAVFQKWQIRFADEL
ncbi:MAG: ABC transporter permease [Verrucomicrobiota bacterium]|nr:ABC transporter permease [Verrucomicrobiota bacterium]